jgi:hypothetical protein
MFDENDTEAAGLIDQLDQVQDEAENVQGGGCQTVALLILVAFALAKILV